jgi:queuosine precursor transporter
MSMINTNITTTALPVEQYQYRYKNLLLALYITFLLLVVVLANRFVILGGLLEPGGIFIFPLTFLVCDIIGEVYGYSLPRQFIWMGALCELIFAVVATSIVHLPYPAYWHYWNDYDVVFNPTIRYVFSGLLGLLAGEFLNIYLLIKWKIKLQGKLFWLRSIVSTAFGQATLSIIVDISAFTGSVPMKSLTWMMFCGFAVKMLYAIVLVYPAWLIVKFLKKKENIDIYDFGTNFNPFKLSN